MNRQLRSLTQNIKTVFLVDGLGAVLSATMLGLVLAPLHTYIGMPKETLHLLASAALVFAIYSLACYAFADKQGHRLLLPVIIANSSYSAYTCALVWQYQSQLSPLGMAYFVGELGVLFVLVYIEYKTWEQRNAS